jgi:hypothetical protein
LIGQNRTIARMRRRTRSWYDGSARLASPFTIVICSSVRLDPSERVCGAATHRSKEFILAVR